MAARNQTPARDSKHRQHHHHHHLQLIEDQSREIQTLLRDNQRLAALHVALKQEVLAAEQDIRHLSSTAASVKAESEAQVREVYDRFRNLEAEAEANSAVSPVEMDRVRADVEELRADRKELLEKLKDVDGDLTRTHLELKQVMSLKAEIEAMHVEIQRGRSAIEYERKMRGRNLELSEVMEKHLVSLSHEVQKVHSELANAQNRAMEAAAATAAAANPDPGYGYATQAVNLEPGYGENQLPDPYAVHQGAVDANSHYAVGAVAQGTPGPYDVQQQNQVQQHQVQ